VEERGADFYPGDLGPPRIQGGRVAGGGAGSSQHNRKRVLRQQLKVVGEDSNTVGEGFPNRVSELLLGKSRWRFK
jgi:hypothetical protein